MTNIVKLQEQLKDLPQQALIQYVQNPNGVVPSYLALSEIQRRKSMQDNAAAQAPQQSVAEGMVAESQPNPMVQGVAGLPTDPTMFTGEVGGGIAGDQSYGDGGIVQYLPAEGTARNRNYPSPYMTAEQFRALMGLESLGIEAPIPKTPARKTPARKTPAKLSEPIPETPARKTPAKLSEPIADNSTPAQGIASLGVGAQTNSTRSSTATAPRNEPLTYEGVTDRSAEYDKLMRPQVNAQDEMARYQAMMGDDPLRAKQLEKLAAMEAQGAKEAEQAPWMALTRAGLGMATGKSPFALQNIAQGGIEGLNDYTEARKRISAGEERRFDLESRIAQAQRAEQVAAAKFGIDSEEARSAEARTIALQKLGYQGDIEKTNAAGKFDAAKANASMALEERKLSEQIRNNMKMEGLRGAELNKELQTVNSLAAQIMRDNEGMSQSEALTKAYEMRSPGFGATEQRGNKALLDSIDEEIKVISSDFSKPKKQKDAEIAALQQQKQMVSARMGLEPLASSVQNNARQSQFIVMR